jgi:hypothetical protein
LRVAFVTFVECRVRKEQVQVIQISVDQVLCMLLHLVEQLGISADWAAQPTD